MSFLDTEVNATMMNATILAETCPNLSEEAKTMKTFR